MKLPKDIQNIPPKEIIKTIEAANLCDFGVYPKRLKDKILAAEKRKKRCSSPLTVITAVHNNDFTDAYLRLLLQNTQEILDGMAILAWGIQAEAMILQLPQRWRQTTAEVKAWAESRGISVQYRMTDMRQCRGQMVVHIAAALDIAQVFAGNYKVGTYLSLCRDGICEIPEKVPYGTTVRQILKDTENIEFFSIGQRIYKPEEADMELTEEVPVENGVITCWSQNCCVIQEAEKVLLKLRTESCGKCTFCREGLIQIHSIVKGILQGKGELEKLDIIREIAQAMSFSNQCSMGQCGAEFVVGTMEKFADDYESHIVKKKCRAQKCSAFLQIYIDPYRCTGCMECMDVCEADAIEGKAGYIHMIDEFECTKCGNCMEACEEQAVKTVEGRLPKLPARLTKCGRLKRH